MMLWTVVLLCFSQGEILNAKFKKREDVKHLQYLYLTLSCASRCLVESKCRSFVIYKGLRQCETYTDICNGEQDDRICYRRITDEFADHAGSFKKSDTSNNNQPEQGTNGKRLLLVPPYSNQIPKVYNFKSKTITDYPGLDLGEIRCIIYMPVSKQLLLAALLPDRVQTYAKDGTRKTIARFKPCSLAADEDKKLLFMVKYRSTELYKTSLDSSDSVLCIFKYHGKKINDVVSNVKKKQLYLAGFVGILVLNYTGKHLNTLDENSYIPCLALDVENDILYYSEGLSIRRFLLDEHKVEELLKEQINHLSCNMAYHRGSVFVAFERSDPPHLCEVIVNSSQPSCTPLGIIYDGDHLLLIAVITM